MSIENPRQESGEPRMPNFWWCPTHHLYRGGTERPCADAVKLGDVEAPRAAGNCVGRLCAYERALTEEYPDGIEEDSDTLPDPARAAQRVGDFLRVYGDGRVCVAITPLAVYQIPPLYARDLQALTNAVLAPPDGADKLARIRRLVQGFRAGGWNQASGQVRAAEALIDRIEVIVTASPSAAPAEPRTLAGWTLPDHIEIAGAGEQIELWCSKHERRVTGGWTNREHAAAIRHFLREHAHLEEEAGRG